MSDGAMFAFGPCYFCLTPFSFDPDNVPSVITDSRTGEIAEENCPQEFRVLRPVDDTCADLLETFREQREMPPAWPRRTRRAAQ
jgi:hypothetical protein